MYNGRIKTAAAGADIANGEQFQFLNGTIKTVAFFLMVLLTY
jgi:hypothetical protein